jgi:hypothetical protein
MGREVRNTRILEPRRWVLHVLRFRGSAVLRGARRPIRRVLCIRLRRTGGHLSRPDVTGGLKRPTRGRSRTLPPRRVGAVLLFGLAPGGVCPALPLPEGPVRSYRTVSPLPRLPGAVWFLWHFPSGRPARVLPGTLPGGARTFLSPPKADSGHPAPWLRDHSTTRRCCHPEGRGVEARGGEPEGSVAASRRQPIPHPHPTTPDPRPTRACRPPLGTLATTPHHRHMAHHRIDRQQDPAGETIKKITRARFEKGHLFLIMQEQSSARLTRSSRSKSYQRPATSD